MGPTWVLSAHLWVLSAPDGPHVGPMNFAIRDLNAPPWVFMCNNKVISQTPQYTCTKSHNHTLFTTATCTFLSWMVYCGICEIGPLQRTSAMLWKLKCLPRAGWCIPGRVGPQNPPGSRRATPTWFFCHSPQSPNLDNRFNLLLQ